MTFANQARLSAAGIPQLAVVHGNATAGGAYQPCLSDYVIVVRKQTEMLLAGPPLLWLPRVKSPQRRNWWGGNACTGCWNSRIFGRK